MAFDILNLFNSYLSISDTDARFDCWGMAPIHVGLAEIVCIGDCPNMERIPDCGMIGAHLHSFYTRDMLLLAPQPIRESDAPAI